jgi:hypothetical protein
MNARKCLAASILAAKEQTLESQVGALYIQLVLLALLKHDKRIVNS